jgi:hypothetical protein
VERLSPRPGTPVSGALVTVSQNGAEIAAAKTTEEGKFSFPELKPGKYELAAKFEGFRSFRSLITLKNPKNRRRRELVIVFVLPYPDNCGSYVLKR